MLQVRPFQKEDLTNIVDYFLEADLEHLLGMGVDTSKLLPKAQWLQFLTFLSLILKYPLMQNKTP